MKLSFIWCVEKKTKITLLAMVLLTTLVLIGGAKINALPERCLLCHSMKPEYYTWQASPHGVVRVSCMSCHTPPGIKGFFTAKARGFKEIYNYITGSYVAPIRMKAVVADGACERCHTVKTLENHDYGDIKISHQSHKAYRVACVKCHAGLAHGHIADRKVTYVSDYTRWTPASGDSQMADKHYTKPNMDVCFRCHRLRDGPVECTVCHKVSKIPVSHKQPDFKGRGHGQLANADIMACDNCHRLMTENKVEGVEDSKAFEKFLSGGKTKPKITASYYSRVNRFCKDCHKKRPNSHDPKYISNHKVQAAKSKVECLTCHNNQQHRSSASTGSLQSITQLPTANSSKTSNSDDTPPSDVTCASCHPSLHTDLTEWKSVHPVPVSDKLKINRYCYYCHNESQCSACHGKVQAIKIKKEE